MAVYLGTEEFPDEVLRAPDNVVTRIFLDRARERATQERSSKVLIERWMADLRKKRRALRRRAG